MGISFGIQVLNKAKSGVGILVEMEQVVEVRLESNDIMSIKLIVGSKILNVVSVYVPNIALAEDIKRLLIWGK